MKITAPQLTTCPALDGNWVLTERFRYQAHGVDVTIPRGFVTDLASIPRLLWRVIAPFELSLTAPILHDYAYRGGQGFQFWTREEVDKMFLEVMKAEGVSWWRRTLAYQGVRLGGASSWGATKVQVIDLDTV